MNVNSINENERQNQRLHAVVEGLVQGVGFRYFVSTRANQIQLTGICRNLRNGNVEVIAEGPKYALDALVVDLRQGPKASRVDKVHAVFFPFTGEFTSFRITATK